MPSTLRKLHRLSSGDCDLWLASRDGAAGFRRWVILKEARTEQGRLDLEREALVIGALSHPNIIQVHDFAVHDDRLTLVMEYVAGATLERLRESAREARLGWPIATRIVADAARGLGFAHLATDDGGKPLYVVHRDVTPSNLIVATTGFTRVVDFGIARSNLRAHTVADVVRGTFGYLSPEQAAGKPLDWRSDVFSLGVVLFELLSGKRLLHVDPARLFEPLFAGLPPLPEEVPDTCRDVLRRMLALDLERRAFPMDEVADALEAVASAHGGSHADVALVLRAELGSKLDGHRRALQKMNGEDSSMSEPVLETCENFYERLEGTLDLVATHIGAVDADTTLAELTRLTPDRS